MMISLTHESCLLLGSTFVVKGFWLNTIRCFHTLMLSRYTPANRESGVPDLGLVMFDFVFDARLPVTLFMF